MKKMFLLALLPLLGLMMPLHAATVNYTADNTTIFPNPERGFLTQLTRHANGSYNAVKGHESHLKKHASTDNVSLVLVLYYLDEFNATATLPEAVFTAFEEDMQTLRDHGMKAILRIAYAENDNGASGSSRTAYDAPLSIIEHHLAQYKSHWEANADVIFVFQAGFVGQYGEWYYTNNFGNHVSTINEACRALLDTALKTIPTNRCLLLRRPMFKQEYLDGVALTKEEAYTGTPKARLGHFNDAFLYGADNMGTYSSTASKRTAQKALIAQETLYVPLGGETDIIDADQAATDASHDATVAEMSTMHWTFIKNSYSETVTDMWRANGTFDELNRNMGYRYQLVTATLPDVVKAGGKANISIQIRNAGYAPLYNERHAYIVLKNELSTFSIQLQADPRTWLPNGEVSTIAEQITIPETVPAGTYQLYLHLPDAYATLASDPRYAVRFANTAVWDAETGMNSLNAAVTVQAVGGEEPPTPDPDPETDPIVLPATLNKANVTAYSEDMTWYNTDYFDFAAGNANLGRWAVWKVSFTTPGKYIVSEETYCGNGHRYAIQLTDGSSVLSVDSTAKCYDTGDLTITQDAKWNLTTVTPGVYYIMVSNAMEYGEPKLKSITLDLFGAVSGETVTLPATLDKTNVADYSDKVGWYNTDYFDLGVKDAPNTDHWVEWRVHIPYPGEYTITEVTSCPNSHTYLLKLMDGETVVADYTTQSTSSGDVTVTHKAKWNLKGVSAGQYVLRVSNATEWGRPKLKSLTLEYNGSIPTGIEEAEGVADGPIYDVLGRRVPASYHGIVIQNGQRRLQ